MLNLDVPQGAYMVDYPADTVQDLVILGGPTPDEADLFRAQASVVPGMPK